MKIRKAFLWGLTATTLGYLAVYIAQKSFEFWLITVAKIISNLFCQWVLSGAFSIVTMILIGYIIMFTHPINKIINKLLGIKAKKAKSVVLVKWGGNWFYGWLTGTIECDGQLFYRVTIPSAPIPISAQLLLVPREMIMFTNLKKTDHFTQLGSLGFDELRNSIEFWPPPKDE
jgi:uncharacterized membrane protein